MSKQIKYCVRVDSIFIIIFWIALFLQEQDRDSSKIRNNFQNKRNIIIAMQLWIIFY